MKLVIGLGNPGLEYAQTRHNIGFRVVDKFAQKQGWKWNNQRSRAILAEGMLGLEKVILVKPITFMNRSGEAVSELMRWYRVQPEDILVICDDLDLPVGKLRLRSSGSAGGHNGVDDIIRHLHTNQFPRLRIGIGRPPHNRMDTIHYVLGIPPPRRARPDRASRGARRRVATPDSLTWRSLDDERRQHRPRSAEKGRGATQKTRRGATQKRKGEE